MSELRELLMSIHIESDEILYISMFLLGCGIVFWYLIARIRYNLIKYRFVVQKNRKSRLNLLVVRLVKIKFLKYLLKSIALKVSMYTDYSYEKNLEIAAVLLFGFVIMAFLCFLIIMPGSGIIWYIFVAYVVIGSMFAGLILHVFNMSARIRFTGRLPETYKLLNSRYISQGNILKAISLSLELNDFDKAVKRVMRTIRAVLIKNDMKEIDDTFNLIEKNYKNDFLTFLLNLIKQAHYKGGEKVIKEQFENATEEVLLDIENRKDLAVTSRMYIFLAVLMPIGIAGIEKFNISSLNDNAVLFYSSLEGYGIKFVILTAVILYIGYMLFLERAV